MRDAISQLKVSISTITKGVSMSKIEASTYMNDILGYQRAWITQTRTDCDCEFLLSHRELNVESKRKMCFLDIFSKEKWFCVPGAGGKSEWWASLFIADQARNRRQLGVTDTAIYPRSVFKAQCTMMKKG